MYGYIFYNIILSRAGGCNYNYGYQCVFDEIKPRATYSDYSYGMFGHCEYANKMGVMTAQETGTDYSEFQEKYIYGDAVEEVEPLVWATNAKNGDSCRLGFTHPVGGFDNLVEEI